jgi:hypothetical protein
MLGLDDTLAGLSGGAGVLVALLCCSACGTRPTRIT